jgi:hypothetical protein
MVRAGLGRSILEDLYQKQKAYFTENQKYADKVELLGPVLSGEPNMLIGSFPDCKSTNNLIDLKEAGSRTDLEFRQRAQDFIEKYFKGLCKDPKSQFFMFTIERFPKSDFLDVWAIDESVKNEGKLNRPYCLQLANSGAPCEAIKKFEKN